MMNDIVTDAYLSRPMRVRPTFDELLNVYEQQSAKVKVPLHPALAMVDNPAILQVWGQMGDLANDERRVQENSQLTASMKAVADHFQINFQALAGTVQTVLQAQQASMARAQVQAPSPQAPSAADGGGSGGGAHILDFAGGGRPAVAGRGR